MTKPLKIPRPKFSREKLWIVVAIGKHLDGKRAVLIRLVSGFYDEEVLVDGAHIFRNRFPASTGESVHAIPLPKKPERIRPSQWSKHPATTHNPAVLPPHPFK
jgi:hypothetical protein